MGSRRHPRAAARPTVAGQCQEHLHPQPVGTEGREQQGQPVVVDRRPGQCPADVLGDVVVAEADRVGVTERPGADLGAGPDPHSGDRAEPAVGLVDVEVIDSSLAEALEEIFLVDESNCLELTLDEWEARDLHRKFTEFVLAPLRPLL